MGWDAGRAGAVEVNVLPLPIAAVPHAGFLGLHGARHAAAVHVLGQPDVGDARRVLPNQVHVWVQEDGVHRLIPFGQRILKVKAMEVMSFHQVAQSFRLKGSQTGIANLRIGLKVSIVDRLNQLLSDFNNFLFAGFIVIGAGFYVFVLDGGVGALHRLLVSIHWVVNHSCLWFLDAVCLLVEQTLGC